MKILVVEDNKKNMTAAKKAAKEFSEHEFIFVSNASGAWKNLEQAEGIVTDCFLPKRKNVRDLNIRVLSCRRKMVMSDTFNELSSRFIERWGDDHKLNEYAHNTQRTLDRAEESPYGLALMIEAHKQGKKKVLVTDLHCHGLGCCSENTDQAFDGWILLIPLVEEGILRINTIGYSAGEKPYYINEDWMNQEAKELRKADPKVWKEAINYLLSQ